MAVVHVLTVLLFGPPLSAAEHCANGDFETLTPDGNLPAQWTFIAPNNGDGGLSLADGVEGGHSVQVTCTRADGIWGPGVGQVGVVETKAGQWYELRFWARQEGITSGVVAALRNMQDWDANQLWQAVYPSSTWQEHKLPFKASYDLAAEVSRLQFSFDSTGTLWLDRVSLRETEAPKSPNVIDVGNVTNRVPNSSFELGTCDWGTYGHTFLVGSVDQTVARHGRTSFRLDITPERLPWHWNDFTYVLRGKPSHTRPSVSLCTAGYLPVTPGQPMCLSAWVKADRPGGQVRLGLIEDTGADRSTAVRLGTDWTRVAAPVTPQADTAFVNLSLARDDPATGPNVLWVDAVQLERGEAPTDYAPALPVEIGFRFPREEHLYDTGTAPAMEVLAYDTTDAARAVDLTLAVEDFFRQPGAKRTLPIRIERDQVTSTTVALPGLSGKPVHVTDSGFYRLHASWADAAGPQERRLRFGVLHPLREQVIQRGSFLGQNHSFVTDRLMQATQEAGTGWVRSWFVRWDDIEPEQGRFDFAEADAQLGRLEGLGFRVQFCLGDPTSEWASTAPADLAESTGAEAESQRVWWMPRDMALYEGYVAALMERYGKRVAYWEVLNEPVDRKGGHAGNLDMAHNYLRFLEAAGRAATRTGAQVQVMGAGLYYLQGTADTTPVLQATDILSEHRYPGLQSAAGFRDSVRSAVGAMQAKGVARPIWITEYGIYADDDPDPTTLTSQFLIHAGRDSELQAAVATVKHEVIALANGVEKVFFHIGNWPITLNREHGCGFHPFFEWSGIPRKMFVTQNALCWAISTTPTVRSLVEGPELWVYEAARDGGTTLVVWATGKVELSPEARRALQEADAYDVVGTRIDRLSELTEWPVYLRTSNPDASRLRRALAAKP